jgi:triacylglycerol esterase/lipase EstA (alpha/beta hydrolase family)
VDVVGYSAGGVVARSWVRDFGGASLARRVFSLGSPQHGTSVADLAVSVAGRCPTACRQLEPDSHLLRALNAGDETPRGPRFVSVWSTADRVVVPPGSALLAGALNFTVQSICPSAATAHGALPSDPVVQAALGSTLGPGAPQRPAEVHCRAVTR